VIYRGTVSAARPARHLLGVAGVGDVARLDRLPPGSTVHSAGRDGWIYVNLFVTDVVFRDFALFIHPFGIVDTSWVLSERDTLRPLGDWCKGRKRLYIRSMSFDVLCQRWEAFCAEQGFHAGELFA
jgi:hypothetical protein